MYNRFTDKFANNLRIMRGCFNANLSDYGFHSYLKHSRILGMNPVDMQSFKKYMHIQLFGYLKERDFTRLYSAMCRHSLTLKETASYVCGLLLVNGDRTDM